MGGVRTVNVGYTDVMTQRVICFLHSHTSVPAWRFLHRFSDLNLVANNGTFYDNVAACCSVCVCACVCVFSWAFWEKAGGAVQGAMCSEAGFALQTARRGSVPGAPQTGGAQRPPEGRLQSVQVSRTTVSTMIPWCFTDVYVRNSHSAVVSPGRNEHHVLWLPSC